MQLKIPQGQFRKNTPRKRKRKNTTPNDGKPNETRGGKGTRNLMSKGSALTGGKNQAHLKVGRKTAPVINEIGEKGRKKMQGKGVTPAPPAKESGRIQRLAKNRECPTHW